MSRIRTYLLVVIASALAGLIGAAIATGTAQAVVASLVEVVNPSATDPDESRINLQSVTSGSVAVPFVPSRFQVCPQGIVSSSNTSLEASLSLSCRPASSLKSKVWVV